jgi:hypothetical protein
MQGSWEVKLIKKYDKKINNSLLKQKSPMMKATSPWGRCCEDVGKGRFMLLQPLEHVLQTAPGGGRPSMPLGLLEALPHPRKTIGHIRLPAILRHQPASLGRTMCSIWTLLVFTIDIQASTRSLTLRELPQPSILRRPPGRTPCRTAMGSHR